VAFCWWGRQGTGKSFWPRQSPARAVVPFFSLSAWNLLRCSSESAASSVRDLFKRAKENSPCLIFHRRIDAVGRNAVPTASVAATMNGNRDLNQLLTGNGWL